MTLSARAHAANAMRTLGDSSGAAEIARDVYERLRDNPALGPRHEITLITGNQIGHDLRIAGRDQEALDFDRESVATHRKVFGAGEVYTLRAQANLAVDLRMVGDFAGALALDRDIAAHWEDVGRSDPRALAAYINMARSYYGMGAYVAGIEVLERWGATLQDLLGPGHSQVLIAGRTYSILLRKIGRVAEAADVIRENQERVHARFGPGHEFSVAATCSLANTLRELGELDEAARQLDDALGWYDTGFGPSHPLTLVAQVNLAILRRVQGDLAQARDLDEWCYQELSRVLAPDHPYTLCAGTSLATDYALAGDHARAVEMSRRMVDASRATAGGGHEARGGGEHPYLLMRAINLSQDVRATGGRDADAIFAEAVAGLRRTLGSDHPDVVAAEEDRKSTRLNSSHTVISYA